jgi:hypothetical protein
MTKVAAVSNHDTMLLSSYVSVICVFCFGYLVIWAGISCIESWDFTAVVLRLLWGTDQINCKGHTPNSMICTWFLGINRNIIFSVSQWKKFSVTGVSWNLGIWEIYSSCHGSWLVVKTAVIVLMFASSNIKSFLVLKYYEGTCFC